VLAIERIVRAAYQHYIPGIGKLPGPMTDDYRAQVALGRAGEAAVGIRATTCRIAEARARQWGYRQIELYTNELMHENLACYARLGYQQTSHRLDAGFKRVFMRKTI